VTIPEKKAAPAVRKPEKACSTCNQPLRYISQYERWYCNNCKAYEGVKKVEPKPVAAPPAEKPCPTCRSMMKYVPRHRKYYCYTCRAYRPIRAPPQKVTVAVRPTGVRPGARPGVAARPAAAAPVTVKQDGTAKAGAWLIMVGVVCFIITGLLTMMVYSGSMDPVTVIESGDRAITLDGGLTDIYIDTSGAIPTTVFTFNILLFLAILFTGIGIALYGFSMAKWLPKAGQRD
jgi:hypothetical protein